MLVKAKKLTGYKVHCLDGEIGEIEEFVFDENQWAIHYLAVETGTWLVDREVLISTTAITALSNEKKYITVNLTRKQIEDSPLLYKKTPISRQFEASFIQYYGYAPYWKAANIWSPNPNTMVDTAAQQTASPGDNATQPGLRSTGNIRGRKLQASDGEIGHIADFIIDDENWVIRYLDIDTISWWPSKHVLICPQWIESISWEEFIVQVNLTRAQIKDSPEYNKDSDLERDYEQCLHAHYHCKGYWDDAITPGKDNKDKNEE